MCLWYEDNVRGRVRLMPQFVPSSAFASGLKSFNLSFEMNALKTCWPEREPFVHVIESMLKRTKWRILHKALQLSDLRGLHSDGRGLRKVKWASAGSAAVAVRP